MTALGGYDLEIPLGRNIRHLRMAKGMTQRQLADYLHVSVQAVSKWENVRFDHALSNSFAFGGSNACIVISRCK